MSRRKDNPLAGIPLSGTLNFQFWVPGRPQPKARHRVAARGGKAFAFNDPRNQTRESYIRECCLLALEKFPLKDHFPIPANGYAVRAAIYALYPPAANWYPGLRYTKKPDWDNIGKLPWDALSGRDSGRPQLLFLDDQIIDSCPVHKAYWDPRDDHPWGPGYPKEPGTLICMEVQPQLRNPALAPAGLFVCLNCGRDDFTGEKQWKTHTRRCVDSL